MSEPLTEPRTFGEHLARIEGLRRERERVSAQESARPVGVAAADVREANAAFKTDPTPERRQALRRAEEDLELANAVRDRGRQLDGQIREAEKGLRKSWGTALAKTREAVGVLSVVTAFEKTVAHLRAKVAGDTTAALARSRAAHRHRVPGDGRAGASRGAGRSRGSAGHRARPAMGHGLRPRPPQGRIRAVAVDLPDGRRHGARPRSLPPAGGSARRRLHRGP